MERQPSREDARARRPRQRATPQGEPSEEAGTAPLGGVPSATEPTVRNGPAAEQPLSFEAAFVLAEGAVDALERGQLTLEESLKRYEEGLRALGRCYEILRSAEKRIEVLGSELGSVAEGAEGPVWVPAARSAALREAVRAADPDAGRSPEEADVGREADGPGTAPASGQVD